MMDVPQAPQIEAGRGLADDSTSTQRTAKQLRNAHRRGDRTAARERLVGNLQQASAAAAIQR